MLRHLTRKSPVVGMGQLVVGSRRWVECDGVAECVELANVVSGPASRIGPFCVEVGAKPEVATELVEQLAPRAPTNMSQV